MPVITDRLTIPDEEIHFTFVRSSGPGGQNVNKTNTKAILRWSIIGCEALEEGAKSRFMQRFARRITAHGDLIVTSQRFRDQGKNVSDCIEKLKDMLIEILTPPKIRRPTRSTRASRERRLHAKRQRSSAKQQRRAPNADS